MKRSFIVYTNNSQKYISKLLQSILEQMDETEEQLVNETEGEQASDNKIGNSTVGFLSVDYDMTEDDEFTANYGKPKVQIR